MNRLALLLALVCAAALCACEAENPDVMDPGSDGLDAGNAYADFVTAFSEGGEATTCSDSIPVCGTAATCGPAEVLGGPDGAGYAIQPQGSIEVGFLCNLIIEQGLSEGGARTDDFNVYTLGGEGSGNVTVSFDGGTWTTMGSLDTTAGSQGFDLDYENLEVARFVRITNTGSVALTVDAIEALR
jgi:hypothetical protein